MGYFGNLSAPPPPPPPPPLPNMNDNYFINHLSRVIDCYSKEYDNLIIMGDLNLQPSDEHMLSLFISYNLYNLVKENTCFKG